MPAGPALITLQCQESASKACCKVAEQSEVARHTLHHWPSGCQLKRMQQPDIGCHWQLLTVVIKGTSSGSVALMSRSLRICCSLSFGGGAIAVPAQRYFALSAGPNH